MASPETVLQAVLHPDEEVAAHGWFINGRDSTHHLLALTDRHLHVLTFSKRLAHVSTRSVPLGAVQHALRGLTRHPAKIRNVMVDHLEIVLPGDSTPTKYMGRVEGDEAVGDLIARAVEIGEANSARGVAPASVPTAEPAANSGASMGLYCQNCGQRLDLRTRACRQCGLDTGSRSTELPAPPPRPSSSPTTTPTALATPEAPRKRMGCLAWLLIAIAVGTIGGLILIATVEPEPSSCEDDLQALAASRGEYISDFDAEQACAP